MRRILWGLTILSAVSVWTSESKAQDFGDPFFAYYSFFLPRQAALAAQPNINDTINAQVAARQAYATTNRANLYDPSGGYGAFDGYNPNAAFDGSATRSRTGRQGGPSLPYRGLPTTNISGSGPALHYNRAAQFYPSLRSGRGPNRNLAVSGRGVRGFGGSPFGGF